MLCVKKNGEGQVLLFCSSIEYTAPAQEKLFSLYPPEVRPENQQEKVYLGKVFNWRRKQHQQQTATAPNKLTLLHQ